ncbi:MAG: histidinol-phosphatase [Bacteroidota bacterium]
MKLFNFHTHSTFCDGHAVPEIFVDAAISAGMHALGFSAHAPVEPGYDWCIPKEKIQEYCNKIHELKNLHKEKLEIYCGLEADYVPGYTQTFDYYKKTFPLDYIIGSIHLVQKKGFDEVWFIDGPEINYALGLEMLFNNDIQLAVRHYYEQTAAMVITQKPDVIGHFDKIKMNNKNRFFSEDEKWYQAIVSETLDVIAKSGCILEVNTRGKYKMRTNDFFPSLSILALARERNIPVTLSTDAHSPEELIYLLKEAAEALASIGFREVFCFENGNWKPTPIQ